MSAKIAGYLQIETNRGFIEVKNIEKYVESLKESIDWVDGYSDFPSEELRSTIKRSLMVELEAKTDEMEEQIRYERAGKPFNDDEVKILTDFLKGKRPTTWQEKDAILDELSIKLRRKKKPVKNKAMNLGLIRAVDYWDNRI